MNRRSLLAAWLLAIATTGFISVDAMAAEKDRALKPEAAYFIDMLYLKKGKTLADAKKYFDQTVPIVAKHGLRRVAPGFVITQKMAGNIEPQLINVWSVSDPQNTFPSIFADPAYVNHMAQRDATFDMTRSHMFMLKEAQ